MFYYYFISTRFENLKVTLSKAADRKTLIQTKKESKNPTSWCSFCIKYNEVNDPKSRVVKLQKKKKYWLKNIQCLTITNNIKKSRAN